MFVSGSCRHYTARYGLYPIMCGLCGSVFCGLTAAIVIVMITVLQRFRNVRACVILAGCENVSDCRNRRRTNASHATGCRCVPIVEQVDASALALSECGEVFAAVSSAFVKRTATESAWTFIVSGTSTLSGTLWNFRFEKMYTSVPFPSTFPSPLVSIFSLADFLPSCSLACCLDGFSCGRRWPGSCVMLLPCFFPGDYAHTLHRRAHTQHILCHCYGQYT